MHSLADMRAKDGTLCWSPPHCAPVASHAGKEKVVSVSTSVSWAERLLSQPHNDMKPIPIKILPEKWYPCVCVCE